MPRSLLQRLFLLLLLLRGLDGEYCDLVEGQLIDGLAAMHALSHCTTLKGSFPLTQTTTETDVEPLAGLRTLVHGQLQITYNKELTSLLGLRNLNTAIDGRVMISYNPKLGSLDGLEGIYEINGGSSKSGDLVMASNAALSSIAGLRGLKGNLDGKLYLVNNPLLRSLDGLEGLTGVGFNYDALSADRFSVSLNSMGQLTSIAALRNLRGDLPGALVLRDLPKLESLQGILGLRAVATYANWQRYENSQGVMIYIKGIPSACISRSDRDGLQTIFDRGEELGLGRVIFPDSMTMWGGHCQREWVRAARAFVLQLTKRLRCVAGCPGTATSVMGEFCSDLVYENGEIWKARYKNDADGQTYLLPCDFWKTNPERCSTADAQLTDANGISAVEACCVCGGTKVEYARTHSSCGDGLVCDYVGGGRCVCPEGFSGVGCTSRNSWVSLATSSFSLLEPPAHERQRDYSLRIPLLRTRSESDLELKALEIVDVKSGGRDVATPLLSNVLAEIESGCTITTDAELTSTTLGVCTDAAERVADYSIQPPFDEVVWTNSTHGYISAYIRVYHDSEFEESEALTLRVQYHSTLFRDSVLNGPDEVTVVIRDGERGKPRFAKHEIGVLENAAFATAVIERVGGVVGELSVDILLEGTGSAKVGEDFSLDSPRISWDDGDSSPKAVVVPLINDDVFEAPDEVFALRINEYPEEHKVRVVIRDDGDAGEFEFEASRYLFREDGQSLGNASVPIRVTRVGRFSTAVSVRVELDPRKSSTTVAEPGSDFAFESQVVEWENGEGGPKDVDIEFIDNGVQRADDVSFVLVLNAEQGGARVSLVRGEAEVFIQDDDAEGGISATTVVVIVLLALAGGVLAVAAVLRSSKKKVTKLTLNFDSRIQSANKMLQEERLAKEQLEGNLAEAKKVILKIAKEGGSILHDYKIKHSALTFGDKLGEGGFGTVYRGKFNDMEVAIKTVRTTKVTEDVVRGFLGEMSVMAPLKHQNLVNMLGGCWEEGPDKLALVLEYCSKGSLKTLLANQVAGYRWSKPYYRITCEIVACFEYLHHGLNEPLIHRDLKPDNVLITADMHAKVADFGESRRFDVAEAIDARDEHDGDIALTMTMVGTPMFCAPEASFGHGAFSNAQPWSHSACALISRVSRRF